MIPRQSRGLFICGQSPRILACALAGAIRSANCVGLLLATRKRVIIALAEHCHLFSHSIFIQLVFDVLCNCFCVLPYCVHIISSAPKFSVGRPQLYYKQKESFCLPHRHKPFLNPRTIRGFSVHKKRKPKRLPLTMHQSEMKGS